jgi:hypothetical protein
MQAAVSSATSTPVHQAMQHCISEQRFHIHHQGNRMFHLKGKLVFFFTVFCFLPDKILMYIL